MGDLVDRLQDFDFLSTLQCDYRLLTRAPVGLPLTEHTSLLWLHNARLDFSHYAHTKLERRQGTHFFHRKARGVEFTDAGRSLLDDARTILATSGQAVETTRRTARGERGRIGVGVTPTAPFHPFVPRAIRSFREAFSRIYLKLEESISNELIEHLHREQIDAAFIRVSVAESEGLAVYPSLGGTVDGRHADRTLSCLAGQER